MELKMKNGDVRQIAMELAMTWGSLKKDIHLSGTALYRLMAIKKQIDEHANLINETFRDIGLAAGGVISGEGQLRIPDEKIEEVNTQLSEVAKEEITISYAPITLREEDSLPPDLMEAFFDFIVV